MAKFHINIHGEPARCNAKIKCRATGAATNNNGEVEHFEGTIEDAYQWAEKKNAEQAGEPFSTTSVSRAASSESEKKEISGSASNNAHTTADTKTNDVDEKQLSDEKDVLNSIVKEGHYTSISDKKERAKEMIADLEEATVKMAQSGQMHKFMDAMRANGLSRWSYQNRMLASIQVAAKLKEKDEELDFSAMSNPEKFNVQGMRQWEKQGRKVKKGSKSVQILGPILVNDESSEPFTNKKTGKQEYPKKLIGFRAISVFNVTDTEGDEIPRFPGTQSDHYRSNDVDDKIIDDMVSHVDKLGYSYEEKEIADYIPERGDGTHAYVREQDKQVVVDSRLSKKQKASALAHELAHIEIGHVDDYSEYRTHRGQMETEAEMTAYLVMRDKGLVSPHDGSDSFSAGYIASWAKNSDGEIDGQKIKKAMDKATKAYLKIVDSK